MRACNGATPPDRAAMTIIEDAQGQRARRAERGRITQYAARRRSLGRLTGEDRGRACCRSSRAVPVGLCVCVCAYARVCECVCACALACGAVARPAAAGGPRSPPGA
ncbi:hypothetical protein H696_05191 [Fonticula alba]|uniref:Uncharacterized protein n=1 Tax=Fonticula alba TaxID=691883 RepID=A0A058Z1V4_FONAL|nr:hypothetical protein H696_05191 [Fonticula alba]KCV68269.1 hypothetical protein H696_05191 [Fonticula alba]|eukprot:XP_009497323.1 hypothetical protein H696_05191 [Fonticula alba]